MNKTQELKLPPIGQRTESQQLPRDNELLIEQDHLGNSREDPGQKIWDKKTASCRQKLKRFDKFQTAIDERYVPINSFNQKEKKVIESALDVIQVRKKNKDLAGKSETIVEILEQKKEMFLVTMTHGIIEKEIDNLTSQAEERARALQESSQILEKDREDYEQFFEKYKAETKKIEEQNEKQLQKRLAKEQEIKARQITVNSLRTLKVRNEEAIASSLRYKHFLNQLPPKEWSEEQERKKQGRLAEAKNRLKSEWQMNSSTISRKSAVSAESDFDRHFEELVESGENEEIEEIMNDEEMYFKEPEELIEFFNNLEENNLFNIQNSHIAEQKYQELKQRSEERRQQLRATHESHREQKRQLEKQVAEVNNEIKLLKKKKEQNNLLDEKDNKDIKAAIIQEYDGLKHLFDPRQKSKYLPELESRNSESLALLSAIEICMERLWEKVKDFYAENPKLVKDIRVQLERKKVKEKQEESARNSKLEEEKRKNRNNEKKEPILKITGRLDMKRSPPQEKLVVKKQETSKKDVDDDRKYLVE